MVKVDHISPTGLIQFKRCGAAWEYSKTPDLPSLPTDDQYLLFGTAVHQAIETFYARIAENPRPVEIDVLAKQVFSDYVGSQFRYLKQRYEACVSNFIKFEMERLKKFKQYKPTFTERLLESGIIREKCDAYWKEDGCVIDWKTGSEPSEEDKLIQGNFYRKVLNELDFPCTRVLFVMLKDGIVRDVPVASESWIEAQLQYMLTTDAKPNPGVICNWCGYRVRCEFSRAGIGMWSL